MNNISEQDLIQNKNSQTFFCQLVHVFKNVNLIKFV